MLRIKNMLIAVAAVALLATPAMAGQIDNQTYETAVTINVAAEVSCWAAPSIALTLDGKNAENSDAVASTITHINNVDADISVAVAGTLDPKVNFFIFGQGTAAEAIAAMAADANAPAGRVAYTLNGAAAPVMTVLKGPSAVGEPVVYAADAPNFLPDVQAIDLTVTWTIAPTVL